MKNSSHKSELVVCIGSILIAYIFGYESYILHITFFYLFIFLIFPPIGEFFLKGWFKIGEILGAINSKILLTAIYLIVLLPIAFLRKLTGKDTLQLRKKRRKTSFSTRNQTFSKEQMKYGW